MIAYILTGRAGEGEREREGGREGGREGESSMKRVAVCAAVSVHR